MRRKLRSSYKVDGRLSAVDSRLSVVRCHCLLLILLLSCSGNDTSGNKDTYTCPMHPTVVSDKAGTCPVCGMDLVRKAREGEEVKITEDLAKLIQSPNEAVLSSVKTIHGEYKSMPVSLAVEGIITYDTRYVYTVPSRFGGRLEKVFLKYEFQRVSKGQKLAEIYSPELITAQKELLYLISNDVENTTLIESAKSKLKLLGASDNQLNELINRKEPSYTFAIYSSYDGYLITDNQPVSLPVSSSSAPMGGGMSSPTSNPIVSEPNTIIRAGQYVTPGQTLFRIVNTSSLRVELNLPFAMSGSIAVGDQVKLNLHDTITTSAKVDFVQPFVDNGEEFITVRLYINSMGDLKIGQLIKTTIDLKPKESLWVPNTAVADLGLNKVVFIKEHGLFKPKEIITGTGSGSWVEVKGIASSDEIASDAHYLMDSDGFIKTTN